MTSQAVLHRWADIPKEQLSPSITRQFVTGDRIMMAHIQVKQGAVVPMHSHENEQLSYIVSGSLRFWLGEDGAEEIVVKGGEVLHLPSSLPHKVEALEDTVALDVFSPPRQDWLAGDDGYLRGTS